MDEELPQLTTFILPSGELPARCVAEGVLSQLSFAAVRG